MLRQSRAWFSLPLALPVLLGCPSLPVTVRALGLVLLGLSLLQKVVGLAGCPRLLEQVVRLLAGVSVPVVGSRLCSRLLQKLVELVGCWRLLEQAALLEVWLRPLLRRLVVVVGCRWLLEGMAVVVVGERLLELQPVGLKLLVQAVRQLPPFIT